MRNPNITLPCEPPPGCCVIEGNRLMLTARNKGIPFGIAHRKIPFPANRSGNTFRMATVGIVVRLEDRDRMLAAIQAKEAARSHKKTNPPEP